MGEMEGWRKPGVQSAECERQMDLFQAPVRLPLAPCQPRKAFLRSCEELIAIRGATASVRQLVFLLWYCESGRRQIAVVNTPPAFVKTGGKRLVERRLLLPAAWQNPMRSGVPQTCVSRLFQ